jgi:hypothetical protein
MIARSKTGKFLRKPTAEDIAADQRADAMRAELRAAQAKVDADRHAAMDVFHKGYHPDDAASMQQWLARKARD